MNNLRDEKGFFTLIGILLALALICFFVYIITNAYFSPLRGNKNNIGSNGQENIGGTNNKSIVATTKDVIQEMNKKSSEQFNQLEKVLNK